MDCVYFHSTILDYVQWQIQVVDNWIKFDEFDEEEEKKTYLTHIHTASIHNKWVINNQQHKIFAPVLFRFLFFRISFHCHSFYYKNTAFACCQPAAAKVKNNSKRFFSSYSLMHCNNLFHFSIFDPTQFPSTQL